MNKSEILDKLRDDNHYYGEFGKNFISNSDIGTLLDNPLQYGQQKNKTVPMVVGGYFHTLILEPEKVEKFKIIESSTRNTKIYKEISGGEICLLQHEADMVHKMRDTILANDFCRFMIQGDDGDTRDIEYEVPGIGELEGVMFKGKADIINKDQQVIIDLKTSADVNNFRYSAKKYNYDSQAYIYRELFGYDMVFMVIDKNTHMLATYDCSSAFLESGRDKVLRAIENYNTFVMDPLFEREQYIINETL